MLIFTMKMKYRFHRNAVKPRDFGKSRFGKFNFTMIKWRFVFENRKILKGFWICVFWNADFYNENEKSLWHKCSKSQGSRKNHFFEISILWGRTSIFLRQIVILPRKLERAFSGMLIFTTNVERAIPQKYSKSNVFGKSFLKNINFTLKKNKVFQTRFKENAVKARVFAKISFLIKRKVH